MRRVLTFIAIACLTAGAVMAQPRAVGARLGYNFEASYQHGFPSGMLEADAGVSPFLYSRSYISDANGNSVPVTYRYGRVQAVVFYDWMMNIVPNLSWYAGLGVGVSWGYGAFFNEPHLNRNGVLTSYSRLGVPIGVQIGIEYELPIPMNLSLDWRPMLNMFGLRQGDLVPNLLNIAVGVRYRF